MGGYENFWSLGYIVLFYRTMYQLLLKHLLLILLLLPLLLLLLLLVFLLPLLPHPKSPLCPHNTDHQSSHSKASLQLAFEYFPCERQASILLLLILLILLIFLLPTFNSCFLSCSYPSLFQIISFDTLPLKMFCPVMPLLQMRYFLYCWIMTVL